MSLHHFQVSQKIEAENYPFYALIMAAIRKADSDNLAKLDAAWPEVRAELTYRYWSAGGLLPGEEGYTAVGDDNLPMSAYPVAACICGPSMRSVQCAADHHERHAAVSS
jgi:hypothetical protein